MSDSSTTNKLALPSFPFCLEECNRRVRRNNLPSDEWLRGVVRQAKPDPDITLLFFIHKTFQKAVADLWHYTQNYHVMNTFGKWKQSHYVCM